MITFLFWNLYRKPLVEKIRNLANHYDVDVLMFAEMTFAPDVLLSVLNRDQSNYKYAASIGCKKIHIFTRFSSSFIRPVVESDRLTIRHVALPGTTDFLLAVTHITSQLYFKDRDQRVEASKLAGEITKAEERIGHNRTVLVGDLNMNPFDEGLVITDGLHAVMSRDIARKTARIVQREKYPFFYNPMWNFLGDGGENPPGTFYYSAAQHMTYFWHIFDQVLIRPSLIDMFDISNLEILKTDGNTSFLSSNGFPDKMVASDHLPIKFTLNF